MSGIFSLRQQFRDVAAGLEGRVEVSNPAKITGNDLVNGDTNILQLAIYKGESAFDIKSQVTEINIYESIVSPAIFCTMTVADAINLQEDFIINIGSIIRFEFKTPGADKSNEYFLQVRSISGKRDVPGLTMKVYNIELVSIEAAVAQNINMEGFRLNDTSGDLIEKILEERVNTREEIRQLRSIRREQRIEIDRGRGIISRNDQQTQVLARNRKPFEVIHQLALLTNASPEGDALYTFFERKDGYQFTPIEKLMREGKKLFREPQQTDAIFFFDSLRNQDISAVKFRNILAYNISTADNLTEGRGEGVNSVAVTTNPETGENSTPASAPQDNVLTELTSAQLLRAFDEVTRSENITSTEFTHLNEVLVRRRQLLLRLAYNEAQILIYGDTNLTVGNVIECNFPRSISTSRASTDPQSASELSNDSGYYLITHLRHIILNTDRPQHVISCNLMRAEPVRS